MYRVLLTSLLLAACRGAPAARLDRTSTDRDSSVIREATVVAFRLTAVDTLAADAGAERLAEFEAYTAAVLPLLAAQGLATLRTQAESLVVELAGGPLRTIMLRGLDYPFGYVLVEPGFAETILTGVVTDEELLDEATYYFGLDDDPSDGARRQIVQAHAAPRVTR